ncbi:MAG: GNAT family N-acetyltransferase [Bacilli bacterium]|jgi:ribosomal-protein-alanine N-acetyltransferase|nr:GNAT family N-acetyltransferase [Bacilli bacterium]
MDVIKTPRLVLRPFKKTDLNDFYEYASVKDVGEAAGWPHHKSKEESAEILNSFIFDPDESGIVLKETGKLIGSIGLHQYSDAKDFPDRKSIEIGYVLSKDYWGHGYMTEACKALIDYLFTKKDYQMIFICHYLGNNRSERVIVKCGLTYYKTIKKKHVIFLDEYRDELCFYLKKEDYLKMQAENKS